MCLCHQAVQFGTGVKAGEVMAGCGRGVVYRPRLGTSPLLAQDLENGDEHHPPKSYSSATLTLGLIYLFLTVELLMFGIVYPILLIFQASLPSNILSTTLLLVFLMSSLT